MFYAGSQGALITRYDRTNGQTRDIQVYPRFFSGEPASELPDRWQWTFPIMFSPLAARVMYTSSQFLYKTTNDGQTWQKLSPDLTYADPEPLGPTGGPITMDMNGPGDLRDDLRTRAVDSRREHDLGGLRRWHVAHHTGWRGNLE